MADPTTLVTRLQEKILSAGSDPAKISNILKTELTPVALQRASKHAAVKAVIGDTPTYSIDLEMKLVGSILHDSNIMSKLSFLSKEAFYDPAIKKIYAWMLLEYQAERKVDQSSLVDHFKSNPDDDIEASGGQYFLEDLIYEVSTAKEAPSIGERLMMYYQKRKLLDQLFDSLSRLKDTSIDKTEELRSGLSQKISDLGRMIVRPDQFYNSSQLADQVDAHLKELNEFWKSPRKDGDVPYHKTPITKLSVATGGWHPSDLIIIAARPGMGKTSFVLSDAECATNIGEDVAIFSGEMSALQLGLRLVCSSANITQDDIRKGRVSDQNLELARKHLKELKEKGYFIDDTPGITIEELSAKARVLKERHDVQRIYIDYLQLMGSSVRGNRESQVSDISRGLKKLAKELNVPVIALSQLSRAVEIRGGSKRPQLSDLRESGAIEQDADLVAFLYRPEYYQILEDEEGNNLRNVGEIILAKNRHGPTETIKAWWFGERMVWIDEPTYEEKRVHGFLRPIKMNDDEDIPW
jgi:replicative DNA helicase